jgi:pyrroline-5-carboxylate reductase
LLSSLGFRSLFLCNQLSFALRFFLFLEALVDAGVTNGLSRTVATELAVQTMAGSVAMLLDRTENGSAAAAGRPDTTAAELRALVTSPGGTTAAGLRELERSGVRAAIAAAVDAAKTRSEQLGITSE